MFKKNLITKFIAFAVIVTVTLAGCKKDKDDAVVPVPDPLSKSYTLTAKDVLGVSGTVSIAEKTSGSSESVVTITLTGAPLGSHPAHIHMNSVSETGAIAFSLTPIEGSGSSSTTLSASYSTLINYDGYINVHLDDSALTTLIAQGDIGGNELTGTNQTYALLQDSASGVAGSAKFEKRKNNTTLITVDLTTGATLPPGFYPAQINLGSVSTVGTPVRTKTLNPVDGTSRMSVTNVRTLNDNTAITYANWLLYDGFISIHDAADSTNIIAAGNIGAN